ncbi:hypothetical protein KUV80_10070 [Fictibacillus nanhaiensis]|uniref:hypothetical protein n=1 Tax=Fictibacillus nanhaiensis TaxID=742169 RepID=UPI001C93FAEF|nr:hypothetical protein [Fictibacillus nanhaiensis]MBY6037003.1 hypothetical protein [Fictibacillus nanhaiensis]
MDFKTKCYLVYGLSPEGTKALEANRQLNEWIKNNSLGKIIYHEHFSKKPLGGFAVFEVNSHSELYQLQNEPLTENSYLYRWSLSYHPLTHSTSTERFIFQTQYTLSSYRGVSMTYELEN